MSFKSLKTTRANAIDKLREAAQESQGTKGNGANDRDEFFKVTRDKAGNGYAVIRFLPSPEGEDLPWVRYWDHGFQGPGGAWYIEKSLTTLGQEDPVSEHNSALWATGRDEDKELARKQKRRLHYVTNIYVVTDSGNKDNEGKVMQYQFGKKIFDKIMDVMQPEFQDETPINPFDFWEGAEFKIKVRKVDGWVNYDKSEFSEPSEFMGGDDVKLEEVYNKLLPLSKFTDPANYKSYDELKSRMVKVLGNTASMQTAAEKSELEETVPSKMESTKTVDEPNSSPAISDDDAMDYFRQLAES